MKRITLYTHGVASDPLKCLLAFLPACGINQGHDGSLGGTNRYDSGLRLGRNWQLEPDSSENHANLVPGEKERDKELSFSV